MATGAGPLELLLMGLGACTSMTLRAYARRKNWRLDQVVVRLRHGKVYAKDCEACTDSSVKIDHIDRDIEVRGALDTDQRSRLLEIANMCPVHRTLTSEIGIATRLISSAATRSIGAVAYQALRERPRRTSTNCSRLSEAPSERPAKNASGLSSIRSRAPWRGATKIRPSTWGASSRRQTASSPDRRAFHLCSPFGKDAARGARGHSLFGAATDTEIEVTARQMTVTEQRDGDAGFAIGFELVDIFIGEDQNGEPVKSAVVEWKVAEKATKAGRKAKLPASAVTVLDALRCALDEWGDPPASNHILHGVKSVTVKQWRDYFRQKTNWDNDDSSKHAFNRGSNG